MRLHSASCVKKNLCTENAKFFKIHISHEEIKLEVIMRYWISLFALCCCAATGYAQEDVEPSTEVATTSEDDSKKTADAGTDTSAPGANERGCRCGRPKA